MEELRGSIFGFKLVREEGLEYEFRLYESKGIIKLVGGWNGKWNNKGEKVIINKERLESNGMDLDDSYYMFVKGKYLSSEDFKKINERKKELRMIKKEYWDRVDRLVDESEMERKKREKRNERKVERLEKEGWEVRKW